MSNNNVGIFWFRRDLRIEDNHGLFRALSSNLSIIPIFIFDPIFFHKFSPSDRKFNIIYDQLKELHHKLHGRLLIIKSSPVEAFTNLIQTYNIKSVFANEDYEPYATERDKKIKKHLQTYHVEFYLYKDHVIFHKNEILSGTGKPYTVFTPYKNQWLKQFKTEFTTPFHSEKLLHNLYPQEFIFPRKNEVGIIEQNYTLKPLQINNIHDYEKYRDIPHLDKTSHASVYLRYGIISIRKLVHEAYLRNQHFLNELIWREFFMQILYHFPHVENENFNSKYNKLEWQFDEKYWQAWCNGQTGYPIVDAGITQLLQTGYLHNRVRMIVASFLTKHLLIDWRLGEAFFANHLLDYDLSLNNGNWQWAASTGCDAVPYFRIFNPIAQQHKFDPNYLYIKQWIPGFEFQKYIKPIVIHNEARLKAINIFKKALQA
ncbi:MAG: DNA photolyase family protein [Bacteroidales bacterium]|nr:DNA photolyase family protein [Bacteroidales bacterium]